ARTRLGRGPRLAVLAGLAGLNAASEFVSFTKVIAGTPVLTRIDMLGRRPPAAPAAPAGPQGRDSAGASVPPQAGSADADADSDSDSDSDKGAGAGAGTAAA